MPNIITHTLFADEIKDMLDLDVLLGRNQLFEIGANGPDVLFFHGVSPYKTLLVRNSLRRYGSELHDKHINAFYKSALDSIRSEKDNQIRDDMIVYTAGHLCHWALDSVMHPYIFYRTGFRGLNYSWKHHRFESLMDAIMLKLKRDTTIKEYDITKMTHHKPYQARAMARIYVPAIKQIFNEDVRPYMIEESLQDWNDMQKVFRDKSGRKVRILQKIEKPLHLDNLLSGYGVPNEPEDNYDILNLLHTPWQNPATEEIFDDSVLDLWEKAKHRAVRAVMLFLEAVADANCEKQFLDYIDDRDYGTGTKSLPMKVSDPVDLSL